MKYRFWTRIAATSLMLLGDGAFASEISTRSDAETRVSSDTIQILHSIAQNKAESEPNSIHTTAGEKPNQPVALCTHITLPATTTSFSHSPKYKSFIPRAPPAST